MDNYVVGTNDKFTLNIVVHNFGEDAFESMLYLDIPEDINLVHVKTVSLLLNYCLPSFFVPLYPF